MIIEKINLSDCLKPSYNPRKNLRLGAAKLKKLVRNYGEFGLVEPIVVNMRTGHVVHGNQHAKVLKKKGIIRTKARATLARDYKTFKRDRFI